MKKIELVCPRCSAKLNINETNDRVKCDYCGYEAILVEDKTQENDVRIIEQESYARTKGELDAKIQYENKKRRAGCLTALVAMVILFVIGFFATKATEIKKPKVDPFDFVEVAFSGRTGDGEAKIVLKDAKDDIYPEKIYYSIEKASNLFEGDKVLVEAKSDEYRLTKDKKTFQVKGLELYLTDLKTMSKEVLDFIHKKSQAELDKNIKFFNVDMVLDSYQAKNVNTYLLTDKKEKSRLYDAFEVTFKMLDGSSETLYYLQEYASVVERKNPPSIDFSTTGYQGEMIPLESKGGLTQYFFGYKSLEEAKNGALKDQKGGMEFMELK